MKKNKELQKIINKLVDNSFENGKLVERKVTRAIKFLKTLPGSQAVEGLSEYLKGIKREERKTTMFLETAYPISREQLLKAKKIVEKKFKLHKIIASVNPQLLGGFKLRIGDEIWDESLHNKINQIKEVITGGRPHQSD